MYQCSFTVCWKKRYWGRSFHTERHDFMAGFRGYRIVRLKFCSQYSLQSRVCPLTPSPVINPGTIKWYGFPQSCLNVVAECWNQHIQAHTALGKTCRSQQGFIVGKVIQICMCTSVVMQYIGLITFTTVLYSVQMAVIPTEHSNSAWWRLRLQVCWFHPSGLCWAQENLVARTREITVQHVRSWQWTLRLWSLILNLLAHTTLVARINP